MCDRAPENNAIRRAMDACLPRLENEADFEPNDERVIRYLKGESVVFENCGDGWTLVLAGGFPLGWAKAQKGRLKNKYSVSWRWE